MKKNIVKTLIFITAFVMIASISSQRSYASGDTVSLNSLSNVTAGNEVTISGDTTLPEVVITVKKPDGTILYLTTAAQTGGKFQTTFTLSENLASGAYPVAAGSGAVIATATLSVTAKPPVQLSTPAKPVISGGIVSWSAVANENNGYSLCLYLNGSIVGSKVTIAHGSAFSYDFSTAMGPEGSYTVTVTALGAGKFCDSEASEPSLPQVVVKPIIAVSKVTLDRIGISLTAGENTTLTATVEPSNADNKNITWSSSNPAAATVDQNGKVTAVSAGMAEITVTTEDGGKSAACTVTVTKAVIHVTGVSLNKSSASLTAGENTTLTAMVEPANADNKNITWSSSNPTAASVDQSGKVTAVSAGTAEVTVTTEDGGKSAACTVTVSVKPDDQDDDADDQEDDEDGGQDTDQSNGNNDGRDNIIEAAVSEGNILAPISEEELNEALSDPDSTEIKFSMELPDSSANPVNEINISPELLHKIADSGKSASFTVKGDDGKDLYTWNFGSQSTGEEEEQDTQINLYIERMNLASNEELNQLLRNSTGEDNSGEDSADEDSAGEGFVFRFAYDGVLPEQTSVRIYVGDQAGFTSGRNIYLYHYNDETGKLETIPFSSDYTVDAEGYVTVNLVHCSDYVILTHKAASDQITALKDQIQVTPVNKTLYIGGSCDSFVQLEINMPKTLELVASLKDKTSQSYIGGVTASFTSSNDKVAAVDKNGKITAVGAGKAVITTVLTLYNGKTKTVTTAITVKKPYIIITAEKVSFNVGETFTFQAEGFGVNTEDIVWSTTKKSIVTINPKTGKAAAKSKGTDYVIVKAAAVIKKVKVTVK